jgi:hypothetical protein
MTTRKASARQRVGINATATAGPPFDFAQGKLFGDENKKGNCEGKGMLVRAESFTIEE